MFSGNLCRCENTVNPIKIAKYPFNIDMAEGELIVDEAVDEVAAPSRPQRAACEVCLEQPSKYTCPGCERRTCSLACSKKHKADSGCSGKRDRLKFVSMQEFDDRVLLSGERVCGHAHYTFNPPSQIPSCGGPCCPCPLAHVVVSTLLVYHFVFH